MSVNGMYIANIKFPIFPDVGLKAITVGHVRNVNILTWLQRRLSGQISIFGGQCFLYVEVSFGNCETKETLKNCNF